MRARPAVVLLPALFPLLLLGAKCGEPTGGDGGAVEVTGTWRGTVLARSANGIERAFAVQFDLVQRGDSVTGTSDSDPRQANTTPGAFLGRLAADTLFGRAYASHSPFDDCGNYAADFVALVRGDEIHVRSGTGYDCEGDGRGGHELLEPITIIGGTLRR